MSQTSSQAAHLHCRRTLLRHSLQFRICGLLYLARHLILMMPNVKNCSKGIFPYHEGWPNGREIEKESATFGAPS